MAFPTIFNNLPAGNEPASLLDTMFSVVGSMGVIQCTATGTNAFALTPIANMPTVSGYANYQQFGFVCQTSASGNVTINVSGAGALNLYLADGRLASGLDLIGGTYYVVVYNSALNSGAGGFQLVSAQTSSAAFVPQGRLTLSSSLPVLTGDATAQGTVYYLPYVGQKVPVYNGNIFSAYDIGAAGLSIVLDSNAAHGGYQQSGKNFDLFLFINAGVLTLGTGPAWSTDTARGTGVGTTQINMVNGLWVNTVIMNAKIDATATIVNVAASSGLYVGTLRATANGQTGMSFKPAAAAGGTNNILGLYNAYNRLRISGMSRDNTASWTDTAATWRGMNTSASNRISWVDGLQQSSVEGTVQCLEDETGGQDGHIGMSLNSTAAVPAVSSQGATQATVTQSLFARDYFPPQIGFNFLQAMEYGSGATVTFRGLGGGAQSQAFIVSLEM